ncbi:MAG: AAA family ATPase [Rhodospirillaceae bacterium]|jgi:lon-related putative ATP-dependent protease|nr:AAA family ATPase [Rhodospirillaceae bacterium]MBT3494551.1 AAA family ATPase [Rhodospirillaceae bacterium]MBT3782686.1 AAA family ATPase [Rhodospirillaceae bacterium]MBT3974857.1 AAA family ATPase [Rhodospirillaceae bacterium]MBT4169174.1 AAA family ATPase [Rhodospirillaceae bacterium]
MPIKPLKAKQVYRRCDAKRFRFRSTAELADLDGVLGQARAVEALLFGIGMDQDGYNLFVLGPRATGRHTIARRFLARQAAQQSPPDDWAYINNFDEPHKPRALRLPAGRAGILRHDMARLVEELLIAIPAAFQTDEYKTRREAIQEEFQERQESAFGAIQKEAQKRDLALVRTPMGFALAPARGNEVMPPDEFHKLPEVVRKKIEADIEELQGRLQEVAQQLPDWERERRRRIRELNQDITGMALSQLISRLRKTYAGLTQALDYIAAVERDISEHVDLFLPSEATGAGQPDAQGGMAAMAPSPAARQAAALRRYSVNVMVGDGTSGGAPVIAEESPSLSNLIGRVEHQAEMGALLTDFSMIKPGSLHRANGGYLIIDALRLLQQPYAWEALKRVLRSNSIRIESPGEMLSLVSTVSLEPEPIPLDIKVVLIGERRIYYLLCQQDPDFDSLFKVAVDFDESMERGGSLSQFAQLIATMARRHKLRPLNPGGVARVVEQATRLAGDVKKLSLQIGHIADLLKEADYWAGEKNRTIIAAADVQAALDAQVRRVDRLSHRMRESIVENTILIDTDGAKVGQINGLAVLDMGNFAFGKASRISARVRIGNGEVIDIERRVDLGGPLHSKGVLILSSYLGARYAADHPLSLSASLVFEQSYGGVDGDSASSAELYVLLSALADLPINQGLAVTGSVNQHGEVQAIGGVNEKVEGFFDLCQARGLTGQQGVLIPKANVPHLMLRADVVDAVRSGKFSIYAVASIDQGIELLTGCKAGRLSKSGRYPAASVNRRVQDRIHQLADMRRQFARNGRNNGNGNRDDGKNSS